MIRTHSDDPDVTAAATQAADLIRNVLADLPSAREFDYGGHILNIGDYDLCERCTSAIAEAQAAHTALQLCADLLDDPLITEHVELAAKFFRLEAETAIVRAEFHNGQGTEPILNRLLGYEYERRIGDDYQHSHHRGEG